MWNLSPPGSFKAALHFYCQNKMLLAISLCSGLKGNSPRATVNEQSIMDTIDIIDSI